MNLYRVEMVGYVSAESEFDATMEFKDRIGLAEERYEITKVEDTGESVPDECRIVDNCPCPYWYEGDCTAGEWTCPYWYEGGCTLENCRSECDEWYK